MDKVTTDLLHAGRQLVFQGHKEEALRCFEQIIEGDQTNLYAKYAIHEINENRLPYEQKLNETLDTFDLLRELIKKDKNDIATNYYYCLLGQNIQDLATKNPVAFKKLGSQEKKRLEKATGGIKQLHQFWGKILDLCKKVIDDGTDDVWLLEVYSKALAAAGKATEAANIINQLVTLDKTNPDYWVYRSNALYNQADLIGAQESAQHAVRLAPRYYKAWENFYLLLVNLGEDYRTIEAFWNMVRLHERYVVFFPEQFNWNDLAFRTAFNEGLAKSFEAAPMDSKTILTFTLAIILTNAMDGNYVFAAAIIPPSVSLIKTNESILLRAVEVLLLAGNPLGYILLHRAEQAGIKNLYLFNKVEDKLRAAGLIPKEEKPEKKQNMRLSPKQYYSVMQDCVSILKHKNVPPEKVVEFYTTAEGFRAEEGENFDSETLMLLVNGYLRIYVHKGDPQ